MTFVVQDGWEVRDNPVAEGRQGMPGPDADAVRRRRS